MYLVFFFYFNPNLRQNFLKELLNLILNGAVSVKLFDPIYNK